MGLRIPSDIRRLILGWVSAWVLGICAAEIVQAAGDNLLPIRQSQIEAEFRECEPCNDLGQGLDPAIEWFGPFIHGPGAGVGIAVGRLIAPSASGTLAHISFHEFDFPPPRT